MNELKNSVQKTFAILEYFTVQKQEWGVTELANEIGSNKSTVFRFLSQLNDIGVLDKNENSEKYKLGLKLYELGNRVELRNAFVLKTHPELHKVADEITETVNIAVLKNQQVFYIDKLESPQGLKTSSQIGSYNPAHATALGKVLLANLTEQKIKAILEKSQRNNKLEKYTNNTITCKTQLIKELNNIHMLGYAIDKEELEEGLICVAIPIFNQKNEVVASLSASGPASRFKESKVKSYVQTLQKGADAIKQKIGNFQIL